MKIGQLLELCSKQRGVSISPEYELTAAVAVVSWLAWLAMHLMVQTGSEGQ